MSETFTGTWHITVISHEPGPQRRFIIQGSNGADGIYPGDDGTTADIVGFGFAPWTIQIQNNDGVHGWQDSGMRLDAPTNPPGSTEVVQLIRSEDDPASTEVIWDDIILEARNLDPLIDVPIRPFALRTDDLQMMPDGIFDTALGTYYVGVRVLNTWGMDFAPNTQLLGITANSRAWLGASGIQIIDTWTPQELEAFGQSLTASGHYIVLPPLQRYQSRTVFFKLDCSNAQPGKYNIEFECIEAGMVDPASPRRRITRQMYVSKSVLDTTNHELRTICPEGTVILKFERIAAPVPYILRNRRCVNTNAGGSTAGRRASDELRRLLHALEEGKGINICEIQHLLACYCDCGDRDGNPNDPGNRRGGCFIYPDFPVWPVQFSYTVEGTPYTGATGPLPFQDPWWKVVLIIAAIILAIAAAISGATDDAYHDDEIVIGRLDRWQSDDVDAAVTKLNGRRNLPSPDQTEALDAQSDDTFTIPVTALNGDVNIDGHFMTKAEIDALMASGDIHAFKSGARSGLTHGLLQGYYNFGMPFDRQNPDGSVTHFTIPQLYLVSDHGFGSQPISQHGDSGSLWVHTSTKRMLALNHSGSADDSGRDAIASLIADVAAKLNIRFR